MEVTAAASRTGSKTMADLIPGAAAEHAENTAVRYKRDGAWHEVTYAQLADIVQEIGLGLIDLGVQPGERLCILANTRPEWSYVDMAATSVGAVVVPIYPTNSPEECLWVISDSDASTIVCENDEQLAKIAAIRDQVPQPSHDHRDRPRPATARRTAPPRSQPALETITLEQVRKRGAGHSAEELEARRAAVSPEDPFTFIYTSGTTGPPKGCVLTHGNYRAIIDMICEAGEIEQNEVTYLYLPLAHSYALLVQLAAFDLGSTLVYFGGDTKQIVAELIEVKPTYLPSVPRIFEKAYTIAHSAIEAQPPEERERTQAMIELGMKVHDLMGHGEPVPEELQKPFEEAEEALFKNVRAIFGGRIRHGTSGAAPIAREILEFFWACGVPVLEGYGMTETATAATISTVENHRFGTVGRALPGVQLKIAEDGEILIKGPNIFKGYHNEGPPRASARSRTAGCTPATSARSTRTAICRSPGARRTSSSPPAARTSRRPTSRTTSNSRRWISQAVMHGDQRPYPVVLITLDEEEIPIYASEHDLPEDIPSLARDPTIVELIQQEIDRVNAKYAQVEQVKKFAILDHDLSQATGELTPTLKVKRNVVNERYAELFDSLYAS